MFFEKMQTRKNDGFTLVELIVVIAILAILAGIAVPAYSGYIEKANVAADEQLLHAVNIAFASAAAEHAGGTVNTADLSYGGSAGAMTVTGVASVNGVAHAKVAEAFATYFGENTSSAFKTVARLSYNRTTHMFEIYTTAAQQAAIDTFNKSNLEGNASKLSGSVNELSNALATQLAGGLALDAFFLGGEVAYNQFMEQYGLDENSTDTEVANAAVLYAVSQMKGVTAADITKIAGSNFEHREKLLDTYDIIPTAALTYGVITGYANSEFASTEFKDFYEKNPPTGISSVDAIFENMILDANFQNYMQSDEKGIMADIDGYLSAMNVISGYEGTIDLKDSNAFNNEETAALLNQILGTK